MGRRSSINWRWLAAAYIVRPHKAIALV